MIKYLDAAQGRQRGEMLICKPFGGSSQQDGDISAHAHAGSRPRRAGATQSSDVDGGIFRQYHV